MFIRYFARTDETALGLAALAYCDMLVLTGTPVRLISTRVAELQVDARGRGGGVWGRHRNLLITPMEGGYINVVCGESQDWDRVHTRGVINVLMLADANLAPSVSQPTLMAAVEKFDAVFASDDSLADVVERVTGHRPHVLLDDLVRIKASLCS